MPQRMKLPDEAADLALYEMPEAESLIASHSVMILKLAKMLSRGGMSVEDLVSEGNLGLLRAVAKFKSAKGAAFSTYANYWVRQAMLRALDNKSRTVRLPWQSAAKLKRIELARLAFTGTHGRQPFEPELAKESGLSLRTVRCLLDSCHRQISIDAPSTASRSGRSLFEDGPAPIDFLPDSAPSPDRVLDAKDSKELVRKALSSLNSREAQIMALRFGFVMKDSGASSARPCESCERIGAKVGLSREGVRKIQERSLSKLRAMLRPVFAGSAPQLDGLAV